MVERNVLAHRYFVNSNNQVEAVDLVEETENPDGVLLVGVSMEVSPRTPGSRRPRLKKLPDKQVSVKLYPTGEIISEEATLEATNRIIDMWDNYTPLEKEE